MIWKYIPFQNTTTIRFNIIYVVNLFFRNNFSYIYFAREKVFNNGDNTKKIVFINDGSVLNDIPLVLLISLT